MGRRAGGRDMAWCAETWDGENGEERVGELGRSGEHERATWDGQGAALLACQSRPEMKVYVPVGLQRVGRGGRRGAWGPRKGRGQGKTLERRSRVRLAARPGAGVSSLLSSPLVSSALTPRPHTRTHAHSKHPRPMLGTVPQLASAPGVAYLCGDCGAFFFVVGKGMGALAVQRRRRPLLFFCARARACAGHCQHGHIRAPLRDTPGLTLLVPGAGWGRQPYSACPRGRG